MDVSGRAPQAEAASAARDGSASTTAVIAGAEGDVQAAVMGATVMSSYSRLPLSVG